MGHDMTGLSLVRVTPDDIDLLCDLREKSLREVWSLPEGHDLSAAMAGTRAYLNEAIPSGDHSAYLAFDGELLVGCAGMSYSRVMPTPDDPTGRKGFVTNVYVEPSHRRRGIASRLLDLILDDAAGQGVDYVTLEASDDGRHLYVTNGFKPVTWAMWREVAPIASAGGAEAAGGATGSSAAVDVTATEPPRPEHT